MAIYIGNAENEVMKVCGAAAIGPKGDKGDPGISAYQAAVEEGFVGTEEQWLASLKGDKGDPGDPGDLSEYARLDGASFSGNVLVGGWLFVDSGIDAGNLQLVHVAAPENDHDAANKKYVDDAVGDVTDSVSAIEGKIPTQATYENQLADKDFVNSSIENVAAYFITKDAAGNPFATKAELTGATVFYSGGQVRVPTRNDYTVVLADESKTISATGENPTTRYIYDNNVWSFQYIVNNSGLTAAQWAAVNSGITAEVLAGLASKTYAEQAAYQEAQDVKQSLASVARTGSYNDLTDKPTIPSLTGYATEQWVENKGYLIANADVAPQNMATQDVYKSGNKLVTNDKVFQVKYGQTEYQDIIDAYNADKSIICNYDNRQYRLLGIDNSTNKITFIRIETTATYVFHVTAPKQYTNPATGGTAVQALVHKNREPIATTQNDNSYPSSKAVREYVESAISAAIGHAIGGAY